VADEDEYDEADEGGRFAVEGAVTGEDEDDEEKDDEGDRVAVEGAVGAAAEGAVGAAVEGRVTGEDEEDEGDKADEDEGDEGDRVAVQAQWELLREFDENKVLLEDLHQQLEEKEVQV